MYSTLSRESENGKLITKQNSHRVYFNIVRINIDKIAFVMYV